MREGPDYRGLRRKKENEKGGYYQGMSDGLLCLLSVGEEEGRGNAEGHDGVERDAEFGEHWRIPFDWIRISCCFTVQATR